MTTLGVRRPSAWAIRDLAVVAAFFAWLLTLAGIYAGVVDIEPGSPPLVVITLIIPAVVGTAALFRRRETGPLPVVAGAAAAIALALSLPLFIAVDPRIALFFPLALIGGFLAQRYPVATFALAFALTGTYGTITAFTGIHADSVADKVIVAAWAGLIGRILLGRQPLRLRPTPIFFLLLGYLVVTAVAALATTPIANGIQAFRFAPLYLSIVVLVGYGAFHTATIDRVARALVVIATAVAAYATLRWAVGPAGEEEALQRTDFERQYNRLAFSGDIKVQGSFPNGNLLGLWTACTTPFLLAMAIAIRGRMRLVAAAGLPLSAIALLASGQRAALAAVVAGVLTVVTVHVLSRGTRGPRLGVATAVALTLVAGAAVVYPAVADSPEQRKRYESILTPSEDQPFQERLNKWRSALKEAGREPFGHGLGAANPVSISHRFEDIAYYQIDNSYLSVGYDQGPLVMVFFIATMLVLLVELLAFAIWTRGPTAAVLATAGAGTLVAMLAEFMAADYVVSPPIVAGWLIVGLGVAQFGTLRRRDAAA